VIYTNRQTEKLHGSDVASRIPGPVDRDCRVGFCRCTGGFGSRRGKAPFGDQDQARSEFVLVQPAADGRSNVARYYFPGYPKVPSDEYIYNLKKKAYLNGVSISGTGVRNDFTLVDATTRKESIGLVKDWVQAGQKLGASFIRVFSGPSIPKDSSYEKVLEWMIPAFQECAEYGKKHGVIIGLQHHDDFLKTADQTIQVVKAVNSDWFSVILDVGSVRQGDPYEEIEKLLPYACTWQIKETVYVNGKSTPIDLARIRKIIDKVGFRGFLPFEALGQGEPAVVTAFLEKVRAAMS
jgi:sugar phosphate isomerase/epimerase